METGRASCAHRDGCARCRAWLAEFAAVDAARGHALPRPALTTDFDRRLQVRIDALARPRLRGELLADADREYGRMLAALRAGHRWNTTANVLAAVAVAVCALIASQELLAHWASWPPALGERDRLLTLGAVGMAIVVSWSSRRGPPLLAR